MIRVGIADDQQLVRAGFSMVVDSQEDMTVLWEASHGHEAYELAQQQPVEVIIMDVQMPRLNGIQATEKIVTQCPDTRIIMLTTFDVREYILDSITAGASGFLLKDTDPEELLHAIRTVDDSSAIISPKATVQLLKYVRDKEGTESTQGRENSSIDSSVHPEEESHILPLMEPLTHREEEVLALMAQGYSNQEISEKLCVALSTVKTHVRKVLIKTQSRDRVQAVLFAYQNGLRG